MFLHKSWKWLFQRHKDHWGTGDLALSFFFLSAFHFHVCICIMCLETFFRRSERHLRFFWKHENVCPFIFVKLRFIHVLSTKHAYLFDCVSLITSYLTHFVLVISIVTTWFPLYVMTFGLNFPTSFPETSLQLQRVGFYPRAMNLLLTNSRFL